MLVSLMLRSHLDVTVQADRAPLYVTLANGDIQNGYTVNRCEGIGWTGGCTDTNELNYLAVKTMRSLGVCYFETQARV